MRKQERDWGEGGGDRGEQKEEGKKSRNDFRGGKINNQPFKTGIFHSRADKSRSEQKESSRKVASMQKTISQSTGT